MNKLFRTFALFTIFKNMGSSCSFTPDAPRARLTPAQICEEYGITDRMARSIGLRINTERATTDLLHNVLIQESTNLEWWFTSQEPVAVRAQAGFKSLFNPPLRYTTQSFEVYRHTFSPMWASPQAWVFSKKRFIQRLLPLGQCSYLHAAIVCQYYASLLIPVDLRQFALNYLEPKALLGAITHTGSGWSKSVFRDLLGHNHLAATSDFDNMRDMLVKYGPGLVSEMRIVPEMYEGVHTVFRGPQPTQFVGTHSMVLVGIREDRDGKFVLLQKRIINHKVPIFNIFCIVSVH